MFWGSVQIGKDEKFNILLTFYDDKNDELVLILKISPW